jgi:hypothetical protein
MNAQEKAKELVNKYLQIQHNIEWTKSKEFLDVCIANNETLGAEGEFYWHELAKQCALIAVDEMIMQNGELFLLPLQAEIIEHYKKTNSYLFEVKEEINKL